MEREVLDAIDKLEQALAGLRLRVSPPATGRDFSAPRLRAMHLRQTLVQAGAVVRCVEILNAL